MPNVSECARLLSDQLSADDEGERSESGPVLTAVAAAEGVRGEVCVSACKGCIVAAAIC